MTTKFLFNPISGQFDLVTASLTPAEIVGGTPNTIAGFDSTGVLFSPPGLGFTDTASASYSIDINPAWATTLTDIQPLRVTGDVSGQTGATFTGLNLSENFGNLGAATSLANINQVAVFSNYGADATVVNIQNFLDNSRLLAGSNVTDFSSFQSSVNSDEVTMNTFRAFQSSSAFGQNSATHLNGYAGVSLAEQFGPFADIDSAIGLAIGHNFSTGSVVDGYTGISISNNYDTTMNGYRGIEIGANFGQNSATTVDNHIDFQAHPAYQANATLNSYTGLSLGPTFVEGSTTQNIQAINYNMDIRGTITGNVGGFNSNNNLGNGSSPVSITNYVDMVLNPNLGANLTLGNFQGLSLRQNVVAGATVNNLQLMSLGANSTLPVTGNASGIFVDMGNYQTSSTPAGLQVNVGGTQLSALFDTGIYPVQSTGGPFGLNNIGGQMHIAAGHPITGGNFGIGNNLGISILAEDDMPADSTGLGLGFVMNGFLTQIGVATGKSMDFVTFMGAGAQDAYPGGGTGTINDLALFRSIGILPGNGITIGNIYGFRVDPVLTAAGPTNAWGVWVGDTTAENWFANNIVIGGSTGHAANTDIALEVSSQKAIKLPLLTTTQRNALAPLESMVVYNTTTNSIDYYNGVSWDQLSPSGGSFANQALSNLTATAINQSLISDTDATYDLGSSTLTWLNTFTQNVVSTTSDLFLSTQDTANGFNISIVTNSTGVAANVSSGGINIATQNAIGTGSSGSIEISTGSTDPGFNSGDIIITTGNAAADNAGTIQMTANQILHTVAANNGAVVLSNGATTIRDQVISPTTLVNSTGPADIATFSQSFKGLFIDYSVFNNVTGDLRTGRITIAWNPSAITTSITDVFNETAVFGLTFTASLSGGLLHLEYTNTDADDYEFKAATRAIT